MSSSLCGGYSNTHLTTSKENKKPLDKRFIIDWLSYTFDDIIFDKIPYGKNKYYYQLAYCESNDYILNNLLRIFDLYKTDRTDSLQSWKQLKPENNSINGYASTIFIGEHIRLNLAGPMTSNDLPSTQLLMSGQACREFEEHYRGDWFDLFGFLTKFHEQLGDRKFNGSFKRIDIAIDDFTGKEMTPYFLEEYARKGYWIGSYQTLTLIDSISFRGDIESKGYSLTFGRTGSNMLQIYDKKLERKSKNLEYADSEVWYRYEMRFIDPKSNNVVELYKRHYVLDNLNELAFSLLNTCIEFKVPNLNDIQNIDRWETLPEWNQFVNYVKKVDIKNHLPKETTIESKKLWWEDKIITTVAQWYIAFGDDFLNYIFDNANEGSKKLTERHLVQIDRYLTNIGKEPLSNDFKKRIMSRGLM